MALPTFVSEAHGSDASSNAFTVTKPSGGTAGRLGIIVLHIAHTATTTFTPPAGWNIGPNTVETGGSLHQPFGFSNLSTLSFYWKVLTGSEASTEDFAASGTTDYGVFWTYMIFDGVDTQVPFDCASIQREQSGGATVNVGPTSSVITTYEDNVLLVGLVAVGSGSDITGGSGFDALTPVVEFNVSGSGTLGTRHHGIAVGTADGSTAGAKYAGGTTYVSAGSTVGVSLMIGLRPASASVIPNAKWTIVNTGEASATSYGFMPGVLVLQTSSGNLDSSSITSRKISTSLDASPQFAHLTNKVQSGSDENELFGGWKVLTPEDCAMGTANKYVATTNANGMTLSQFVAIIVNHSSSVTDDGAGVVTSSDSTTPDGGGSISCAVDDLIFSILAALGATLAVTSAPSGYTSLGSQGSAGGAMAAAKKIATSTTEDPGTWTVTSNQYVALTVRVLQGVLAPSNSVAPDASGDPTVGETLSVTNGTWLYSPDTYTYQWKTSASADGSSPSSIGGATSSTYEITGSEEDLYVFCTVTATNEIGSASANSDVLGPVAAAGGGGVPGSQSTTIGHGRYYG